MSAGDDVVRDRLWIFTCFAGADHMWLERSGVSVRSRMTPAEGAFYLGVPNLILVRAEGQPPPEAFEQYARSFRPLDRVVWSIVGSGGRHEGDELPAVLDLAARFPNIRGVFMDDFFKSDGGANLSVGELREVRDRLDDAGLDLWVVTYTHMLDEAMRPWLELCDVLTLWTWSSDHLDALPDNLARLEAVAPDARIALGCYFWDYPNNRPVPLDREQRQCEAGLRWLHEGRIEAMVFLANTVCDYGFEHVEWTRQWIHDVGGQEL